MEVGKVKQIEELINIDKKIEFECKVTLTLKYEFLFKLIVCFLFISIYMKQMKD